MSTWTLDLSPTARALVLVGLALGLLLITAIQGIRKPVLWRMGLRNVSRRPSQTLIMLCGLALSTVFITASFGLQDSYNHSQAVFRLEQMGNVDEAVTGTFTQARLTSALTRLQHVSEVEAAAGIAVERLSTLITPPRTGLTTAAVDLYAVPRSFDRVYGALTDAHGHHVRFADLSPHEVFVSASLAHVADIHDGDTIQVSFGSHAIARTVRAVLSHDIAMTTGELDNDGSYPEVIMPLASAPAGVAPNTVCIKNVGQGGMDDTGPGGNRSRRVTQLLEQLFRAGPDPHGVIPTPYNFTIVHPLKPDELKAPSVFNPIAGKGQVIRSPAARQFDFLLPIFTVLLIAAGSLLLVLLVLLLAAERRAELGMGRAIGLQRSQLVHVLMLEGCAYGVTAPLLGLPLGMGGVALALVVLSRLSGDSAGPQSPVQPGHVPLHVWLTWQSALSTVSIGILTTGIVVLGTAVWISRTNIVAAMRNLDEPPPQRRSLLAQARAFSHPPRDTAGQQIPETSARRRARRIGAVSDVLWGLIVRGLLGLVLGVLLLTRNRGNDWMPLLGQILVIAGAGLFAAWLVPLLHVPLLTSRLARRMGASLIGLGWITYGLPQNSFLFAFEPVWNRVPSVQADLLSMLVPLVGLVVLVMANVDLVVALLTQVMSCIPVLAPVSGMSLIYPLTFRFRTGVTVALLSLITFLTVLLVTTNLSLAQQQGQVSTTTGNFQLEMDLGEGDNRALASAISRTPTTLRRDIAAVTRMRYQYGLFGDSTKRIVLLLPNRRPFPYQTPAGPMVVDDTYLSLTTMPTFARAQGYSSDRQVWNAVRDHPGSVVLRYDNRIPGLPADNGFAPIPIDVPESGDPTASYHRLHVIGLLPATTHWPGVLLSTGTAAAIGAHPSSGINFYYFRLQPGVNAAVASIDLNRALQLGRRGIQVSTLDATEANVDYTANLTLFLGSYLGLGLLFGALAIAVIASRAVVERRQQIGMLRALGFSRTLVRRSFLVETGFVITLGLGTGTGLAWWVAYQVARQGSRDFPIPVQPIGLLLIGSYLVSFLATVWPARQASRLPPAEALRYE